MLEQPVLKDKSSLPPLGNIGQSAAKDKKKMNSFICKSIYHKQLYHSILNVDASKEFD